MYVGLGCIFVVGEASCSRHEVGEMGLIIVNGCWERGGVQSVRELFEQGWWGARMDRVRGGWEGGLARLGNLRQHVLASAGQEWAEMAETEGLEALDTVLDTEVFFRTAVSRDNDTLAQC